MAPSLPATCTGAPHQSAAQPPRAERTLPRTIELDGLDGGGNEPAADRSAMRGQDKVGAALDDLDLLGHRVSGPAEVGLGDHVEDDLARCGDLDQLRAERAGPP